MQLTDSAGDQSFRIPQRLTDIIIGRWNTFLPNFLDEKIKQFIQIDIALLFRLNIFIDFFV
ncbi:hypothetical protein C6H66_24480 [Photorhabdus hindustanensis]|uniref:Uncharacterized protein n=1 Tax=Photorhabdus hindustanensis TaxID=2918802 RepID=A0A2S8PTV1_9GAMM|nr:hypothetical protein C6H66_24480 [Photorhabdus hindustanensis]